MITVEFLPLHSGVKLPKYATDGSAGVDLIADNFKLLYQVSNDRPVDISTATESCSVRPGGRMLIGLGFSIAIPEGYELQIRPRSGNALKKGITILNSPGTIDSDYRNEVGVILINHSTDTITIKLGDAIAQGVLKQVEKIQWKPVPELSETSRKGGFGSTDNKQEKPY